MTARLLSGPSPRLLTMGVAALLALALPGAAAASDSASAATTTASTSTSQTAQVAQAAPEPASPRGLRLAPASDTVDAYRYGGYVVSYRTVILGGEPGARTVQVPPYEGLDTETGYGPED